MLIDISTVYNKWHETELERWLSDHNVPYPTPADRKDLENLVKNNWQSKIAQPYNDWSPSQMSSYLAQKGIETKDAAADNKDSLVAQVKNYWYETEDKAEEAYGSVKDWIFDRSVFPFVSFENDIANNAVAGLVNLTSQPSNTLLIFPKDSQLKAFADRHDIPVPQPRQRDTLIAKLRSQYETVSKKAGETASYPGNWLYETWSESGELYVPAFEFGSNI